MRSFDEAPKASRPSPGPRRFVAGAATVWFVLLAVACQGVIEAPDVSNPSAVDEPAAPNPGTNGGAGTNGANPPSSNPNPNPNPPELEPCTPVAQAFESTLYSPVFSKCAGCHNAFGLAGQMGLRFELELPGLPGAAQRNSQMLERIAAETVDVAGAPMPLLLAKPTAGVGHVGGQVFAADSAEAQLLASFIEAVREPEDCEQPSPDQAAQLLARLDLDAPRRTYARAYFALTGRVATPEERDRVPDTEAGLAAALDDILSEESFQFRLADFFADSFMNRAWSSVANPYSQGPYLYRSGWRQLRYFNNLCEGEARNPCCHAPTQECCYEYESEEYCESSHGDSRHAMARTTDGMVEEPLELVKYLARNDRPVTELVTAEYTMVNPWSAAIYGIPAEDRALLFDEDPLNDRWEYVPAVVPANELNGLPPAPDGGLYWPHAGILSSSGLLNRYRSTPSNFHRGRASRLVLPELLAVPVLDFADFNTNSLPAGADLELATQEYAACTSCHAAIDPIGGFFRFHPYGGRYVEEDHRRARMPEHFPPASFLGEAAPDGMNPLLFLGTRIAEHPRYPLALVRTVLRGLVGTDLLKPPPSLEDPAFEAKALAFQLQQRLIADVVEDLSPASELTFRQIVRAAVQSPFFRAGGAEGVTDATHREALAIAGIGGRTFHTPKQLSHKLQSVTGVEPPREPGARGDLMIALNKFGLLLGGTDWNTVPHREREPSPVSARILERMAHDYACRGVVRDFSRVDPEARSMFTLVEPETLPDDAGRAQIEAQVVRLHRLLLNENLPPEDPEIQATVALFEAALSTGQRLMEEGEVGARPTCSVSRPGPGERELTQDPDFVVRAWTAVVAYLLSDARFVME